jgi:hypothetical protein
LDAEIVAELSDFCGAARLSERYRAERTGWKRGD